MKKLFIMGATMAALSSSPILAQAASNENSTVTELSGPYIGVYGGYDWTDVESAAANTDIDGWDGGVFAGYKLDALMEQTNGFGIGMNGAIEGFYGISEEEGNTFQKENEWGVSFRPGFSVIDKLTDPMGLNPYAIIGYRNTSFDTGTVGSKRFNGFELGAGTQLIAYGDFGIRAEYSHVWYNGNAGHEPDSDEVRVGISYHF